MKRIISLMFLLFSITLFSQSEKVNFENELIYELGGYPASWYVSNEYPNLILVTDLFNGNFLYYLGRGSYYALNENNEIEYNKIRFKNERTKKVEITKSDKKEVVNGYKCDRYIVVNKNNTTEIFITNDTKINNIMFFNSVVNEEKSTLKSGLIVKVSVYNPRTDKYDVYFELSEIKKSEKYIYVDFEQLDLRLDKPQNYPDMDWEIAEPVRDK